MAGGFGLYVNGQHDYSIGYEELNGVLVDDAANVHATGWYYDYDDDDVYWKAAYYRNGSTSVLPMTLQGAYEAGAWDADLAPNGDAYVVGYEMGGGVRAARHWKVTPDGDATPLALPGIIETNYTYSYARAVRVHNGDVYVVGGAEDEDYGEHPVIWKNQVKHEVPGHSFTLLQDVGFDSKGVMYVLGSDGHIYTVAPDLSSVTRTPFGDASGQLFRMFIDGDDVYAAGYVGNYAYYWKNGERLALASPQDANWTEAGDVFVLDGHVYVVGHSYHGLGAYRAQLWIDDQPVHDDRSIEDAFATSDKARASAVFVKQLAKIPVTGVELSSAALDIPLGHALDLTATVLPAEATNKNVVWTSSDPGVASISGRGLTVAINGLALGTATITAASPSGPSAACTVNVVNVPVSGVSLSTGALAVGRNRSAVLVATIVPFEATDKTIAWVSSAPSVATVSGTGLAGTVLGVTLGAATITATTQDGSHVAECAVTVGEPTAPAIHLVGDFGLYTDGAHNAAVGDQLLRDVFADGAGNIHAAGYHYDAAGDARWRAAHYRNGEPTILEMGHGPDTLEMGATGMSVADSGDVYVSGYELFNGELEQAMAARLWKNGQLVPLGTDETGSSMSYAAAVRLHSGDAYVAGFDDRVDGRNRPSIWRNGAQHLNAAMANYRIIDFGIDAGGVLTVLCYNDRYSQLGVEPYTLWTVQPDLTTWAAVEITGEALHHPLPTRVFVDGTDVYWVGSVEDDAYYWKNGAPTRMELPEDALWVEAHAVHVLDGRVYAAGRSGYPDGFRLVQWIDGAVVADERAITATLRYSDALPHAIFAQK
jgi:uncharacterized protein YjdB